MKCRVYCHRTVFGSILVDVADDDGGWRSIWRDVSEALALADPDMFEPDGRPGEMFMDSFEEET